jgi:hypothetical protein
MKTLTKILGSAALIGTITTGILSLGGNKDSDWIHGKVIDEKYIPAGIGPTDGSVYGSRSGSKYSLSIQTDYGLKSIAVVDHYNSTKEQVDLIVDLGDVLEVLAGSDKSQSFYDLTPSHIKVKRKNAEKSK